MKNLFLLAVKTKFPVGITQNGDNTKCQAHFLKRKTIPPQRHLFINNTKYDLLGKDKELISDNQKFIFPERNTKLSCKAINCNKKLSVHLNPMVLL